jgi:hypothetical protein
MPKLDRLYAAQIALKEAINKSNPPATRLRWFDRFCVLRSFYKVALEDQGAGSGRKPEDVSQNDFDEKMAKFLEEEPDADKLPAS